MKEINRKAIPRRLGVESGHIIGTGKVFGFVGDDRAGVVVGNNRAAQGGFKPGDAPERTTGVNKVATASFVLFEKVVIVIEIRLDGEVVRREWPIRRKSSRSGVAVQRIVAADEVPQ